jgi:hypothetical protein
LRKKNINNSCQTNISTFFTFAIEYWSIDNKSGKQQKLWCRIQKEEKKKSTDSDKKCLENSTMEWRMAEEERLESRKLLLLLLLVETVF